jgi:hypothetical protein
MTSGKDFAGRPGAMAAPNASERAVKLPAGHSRPHVYHPVGPSSTTMTVAFNL